MRNNEITIHISLKRKDGTGGSSQTIHKGSSGTKWTITSAAGKKYRMSPEQLLSHLFKVIAGGKAVIEVVPDPSGQTG
ncbi:hypothetical protein [Dehalogenimonas alkenigignens]|uniref:Uncharacterized protein n=1 Tax=Dehalogenimonas alkenigignens TaxID=1217799 RepID=A0A0W0GHG3_9CHLR|nr:hypothetical protein [Dehalogenimonas alkenigignens]KTB47996.1 hypothetical protein DEALK_08410 [Dehalogenimonas alkenigignens]PVV84256.1 hypothetical protein DD509_02870 [Dehalogenimonas alkenigignens]